jgi:hypothetical protein
MLNNSKMQKFVWKIEQLDKMISNQGDPIIANDSLYNRLMQVPLIDKNFKDGFTMTLDRWGTSDKKIGA